MNMVIGEIEDHKSIIKPQNISNGGDSRPINLPVGWKLKQTERVVKWKRKKFSVRRNQGRGRFGKAHGF